MDFHFRKLSTKTIEIKNIQAIGEKKDTNNDIETTWYSIITNIPVLAAIKHTSVDHNIHTNTTSLSINIGVVLPKQAITQL